MSVALANPFRTHRLNGPLDFNPAWDVPSLNVEVTVWLEKTLQRVREQPQPDPQNLIGVLLGTPGHGKTHLLGRVAHHLGDDVLFVFVPPPEDLNEPLKHMQWHLVERLFEADASGTTRLERGLAHVAQASALAYLGDLPQTLQTRQRELIKRIQETPLALLDVIHAVGPIEPYLRLADSVAERFPNRSTDVMRALALGWSPAASVVRRWLRGESVAPEQLKSLRLREEPPTPEQVLLGVATLFFGVSPLLICMDQLEAVWSDEDATSRLSSELMSLLQSLPNTQFLLSGLSDTWANAIGAGGVHSALQDRTERFRLQRLSTDQALETVVRRVRDLARPEGSSSCWPFREDTLLAKVESQQPGPRGLIRECAEAFDRWLEGGGQGEIVLGEGPVASRDDKPTWFRKTWEERLKEVEGDAKVSVANAQMDRIARGLREGLSLLREGRVVSVGERALGSTYKGLEVRGGEERVVVVPTSLERNKHKGTWLFKNMHKAMGKSGRGVIVHKGSEFEVGPAQERQFEAAQEGGALRLFSFQDHEHTMEKLECLLRLLDEARAQELEFEQERIDVSACKELVRETGVIEELDLFREVLDGWSEEAEALKPTTKPAPKSAPKSAPEVPDSAPKAAPVSEPAPPAPVPEPKAVVEEVVPVEEGPQQWAARRLAEVEEKLGQWNLRVTQVGFDLGPTFVRLKLKPLGSTTIAKVRNKAEDLKIHLTLDTAPMIDAQAGYISVDVQRPNRRTVTLGAALHEPPPGLEGKAAFPVGQDVQGDTHWLDLSSSSMCHALVAGTTGSGKSEFLKAMIGGLAKRLPPEELELILVDPKRVTFNLGRRTSPYLRRPVAYTVEDAQDLMDACWQEMERRYQVLQRQGVEEIGQLEGELRVPRVVVVFDEFADLMADKDVSKKLEQRLKQLGAKARAAGIHLVLATQRPEASVVTPLVRSNLPARISLKVASEADSKLVLNAPAAASLLGKGDLLWERGGTLWRLQSPFVAPEELAEALRLS